MVAATAALKRIAMVTFADLETKTNLGRLWGTRGLNATSEQVKKFSNRSFGQMKAGHWQLSTAVNPDALVAKILNSDTLLISDHVSASRHKRQTKYSSIDPSQFLTSWQAAVGWRLARADTLTSQKIWWSQYHVWRAKAEKQPRYIPETWNCAISRISFLRHTGGCSPKAYLVRSKICTIYIGMKVYGSHPNIANIAKHCQSVS